MPPSILLFSKNTRVEIIGSGDNSPFLFSISAPLSDKLFLEEIIEQHFGSLRLTPQSLFDFLQDDPFVRSHFSSPEWIQTVNPADNSKLVDFNSKTLGQKLITAGLLTESQLDELLIEFQFFSDTLRFGEFLRMKLDIPCQVLDFFLDNSSLLDNDFNSLRLGSRLLKMGLLNELQLQEALDYQSLHHDLRLGEILVDMGLISPSLASFFSKLKLSSKGFDIDL